MANSKFKYVKKFELDDNLTPFNWIVVRIDRCHFHRFSKDRQFEKPNDEFVLNLMNACAVAMLEQFPDIIFAYGVSDEYSFIWKETTTDFISVLRFLVQRQNFLVSFSNCSKLVSLSVSFFISVYVMKWKEYFPQKELCSPPYFDGRVVCYPEMRIIRDYLWRQADCHINNHYNTCFWMLVKSGITEREAQETLKGTRKEEKNEILFKEFGINYDKLPDLFRKGTSVYREKFLQHPLRWTRCQSGVGCSPSS